MSDDKDTDWTKPDTYQRRNPWTTYRDDGVLDESDIGAFVADRHFARRAKQKEADEKQSRLDKRTAYDSYEYKEQLWWAGFLIIVLALLLIPVWMGWQDAARIEAGEEIKWDVPGHGRLVNPPTTAEQYLKDNPLPKGTNDG